MKNKNRECHLDFIPLIFRHSQAFSWPKVYSACCSHGSWPIKKTFPLGERTIFLRWPPTNMRKLWPRIQTPPNKIKCTGGRIWKDSNNRENMEPIPYNINIQV